jgi:hypothetical protein
VLSSARRGRRQSNGNKESRRKLKRGSTAWRRWRILVQHREMFEGRNGQETQRFPTHGYEKKKNERQMFNGKKIQGEELTVCQEVKGRRERRGKNQWCCVSERGKKRRLDASGGTARNTCKIQDAICHEI